MDKYLDMKSAMEHRQQNTGTLHKYQENIENLKDHFKNPQHCVQLYIYIKKYIGGAEVV